MGTQIKVGQSRSAAAQLNIQQTAANRSNRLDNENTTKSAKEPLAKVNQNDPKKDDPTYSNGAVKDPAAFARKTKLLPLLEIDTVGCVMQLRDPTDTQYRKTGYKYRVRSCTKDGTLGPWQEHEFNHPKTRTDIWNYWAKHDALILPFSEYNDPSSVGVYLPGPNSPGYSFSIINQNGGNSKCVWSTNYGDWSQIIDLNGSIRYATFTETPTTFGFTDMGIYNPVVVDQITTPYEIGKWENDLFSSYPFSYMLPVSNQKAFLVVACLDIEYETSIQHLDLFNVSGSIKETIDYTQPSFQNNYAAGTYYATENYFDHTRSEAMMADAFDVSGNKVRLTDDGKTCFYDIHVHVVTDGSVTKITPPAAVINSLRQYLHPSPADHTLTVQQGATDWGQYIDANQGRQVNYGPTERGMEDIFEVERTFQRDRNFFSPSRMWTYTVPDVRKGEAFDNYVKDNMPLYDTRNYERCLNFQYGVGSLTTESHSRLYESSLISKQWGAFEQSASDIIPAKEQDWFGYFSPAVFSLIQDKAVNTAGYQQYLNGVESGSIALTDKNGKRGQAFYPPHFVLDAEKAGPFMITDPEQWPESLPVEPGIPVNPSSLIDSGFVGGKMLEVCTHISWDWSNPWYCYDKLIEIGFTQAELGARPSTVVNTEF